MGISEGRKKCHNKQFLVICPPPKLSCSESYTCQWRTGWACRNGSSPYSWPAKVVWRLL